MRWLHFCVQLGDSKSPLYFLIISAVINVGLDVAFIIYGGMGVEGCAYATVIAQGISVVLCFIYIVKKFPILHLKKENFRFSLPACGKLMALGVPMALQFSITAIGTIIVQGAVMFTGKIIWQVSPRQQDSECNLHSIRGLRCNDCNLCGTELGSWKSRPCTTRCALYTDYDFGLQRNCDVYWYFSLVNI